MIGLVLYFFLIQIALGDVLHDAVDAHHAIICVTLKLTIKGDILFLAVVALDTVFAGLGRAIFHRAQRHLLQPDKIILIGRGAERFEVIRIFIARQIE